MPLLETPFAALELHRHPALRDDPLQAFDAADEYLLNHVHSVGIAAHERLLILNDSFGALACSLAHHATVVSSGDSFLAQLALRKNLAHNARASDAVTFIPASEIPTGPFDWVLIRVPKTLALLEEQLIRLRGQLSATARVIAAGMVKHLPRAAGDLLEKYLGPVQASLAVKKARLLFCTPDTQRPAIPSPYPTQYRLEQPALTFSNQANVFCREGLDIGSRAFLPFLPTGLGKARVADVGCGNGVLAIVNALANPEAEYLLVDESFMAVQSAAENWRAALGERAVEIQAADGLAGQTPGSLDIVLCNPPFHQQQVVGDFLARRMFKQAHAALRHGGELWIVGNRHLGYHVTLKRLFREVTQAGSTPKFVILRARKG